MEFGTRREIRNKSVRKKLVIVVTKQNLIILCCCFAENGEEMYQEYSHFFVN